MSGRLTPASLEAVRERADIVELVRPDTELRKAGAEWVGRCPFHEERTGSFYVNPGKKVYHCHGCGVGGDVDRLRARAPRARLHGRRRVAGRALQRAAGVRGAEPRGRGPAARRGPQARAPGADGGLLPPRPAREPARRGRPRYLTERGVSWEMAERFQLGYSADEHAGHRRRAQAAVRRPRARRDRHHAARSLGAGRSHDGAPRLHALRRARAADRVRRQAPAARRVRREVRQLAREPALAQGLDAVRPAPRAHRDREGGGGDRRRGLHRRDRARPGGLRQRRGLDGHGADAAAAARAAQARPQRRAALRRRHRRQRGRAARPRARREPRTCACASRCRRAAPIPPRSRRPAARPSIACSPARAACSRSASRSCSTRRTSSSARRARRGLRGAAAIFRDAPATPERDELVRKAGSRLFLDPVMEAAARLAPARRRAAAPEPARPACACRMDAAQRDERLLLALALASGERGLGHARARARRRRSRTRSLRERAWLGSARLNQDEAYRPYTDVQRLEAELVALAARRGAHARGIARGARLGSRPLNQDDSVRRPYSASRRSFWRWARHGGPEALAEVAGASSRAGSNADWNPSRRSSPQPR